MASIHVLVSAVNYVTLRGVETIVTRSVIVTSATKGDGGGREGSKYHDVTYDQSDYGQSRLDFSYFSPAIRRLLENG
jgi:hypothetical protein